MPAQQKPIYENELLVPKQYYILGGAYMAYQVVVPRRQQDGATTTVTFDVSVKDPSNAIPKAKAHHPEEDLNWEEATVI
jgi:hypothetical protein